jgi:hypothetical protein
MLTRWAILTFLPVIVIVLAYMFRMFHRYAETAMNKGIAG